jgi:hypothetical protein
MTLLFSRVHTYLCMHAALEQLFDQLFPTKDVRAIGLHCMAARA